jgi:CheY-like chemotaxis protein
VDLPTIQANSSTLTDCSLAELFKIDRNRSSVHGILTLIPIAIRLVRWEMADSKTGILIVDDESCIRTSMSLVLAEVGYRVRSAEDGFSALREIRRESPEILLSDLNMPGMSGFELLPVVRRRFPAIMVIAMSGAFFGNEVPSGVSADAFYQKGSGVSALLQILRTPPHMRRCALPLSSTSSPVWVQRNGSGSYGKQHVTITCPECLSVFSLTPESSDCLTREMDCIHCGYLIQYAILEPSDQMTSQPFRYEARAAVLRQSISTFGK